LLVWQSQRNSIVQNIVQDIDEGISLYKSIKNNITGNKIGNCRVGVKLVYSEYNALKLNTIIHNNDAIYLDEGVYPEQSSNNLVYLNNIANNSNNVNSYISDNAWNSTNFIIYNYKGKTFKNRLGNYWSTYRGKDGKNGDGIGDTPYVIGNSEDSYPLLEPIESYKLKL
jgi:parallel beta-helix repeat protein